MPLTLITVNYNNARATVELLRALEQQTEKDFDIIVVDNDSAPDDRALLGEYATSSSLRLDIIYSDTNRGFSGGNNLAIRKALAQGSEWLLLINNDTTVEPNFIEILKSNTPQEPCIAGIPLNEGSRVAYGGIVQWLRPTLKHQYEPRTSNLRYAIGAGMLVHRDVFECIGLLDEAYFLYFEDADFSVRARRAGIPIQFLSEPVITHRESESTKKLGSPLLLRYHARNALRFNWYNGPWWVRLATPLAIVYGIVMTKSHAMRTGVFDFIFGRWGRIDTRVKIGIECESIETDIWGVARMLLNLLRQLSERPELATTYRFHLYFKQQIPNYPFLKHPMFVCTITKPPRIPASFNLHYHVWMIARAYWDGVSMLFFPAYMLPLLWFKKSFVMLTEDIWHEMRNPQQKFRFRLAYAIFANWAALRATRIMAISESSKRELVRLFGIKPERISVARLAADLPAEALAKEGANHYGDYVLYVAQAFPRRHLRETVQAFEKISGQFPNLKLIAIGPDKYRPLLDIHNTRIIRKERVSGDELATLYAHAKVFVYVSDREAFGLPPLEALAYGVPSVLADKPVSHELFGDHAFYARPANGGVNTSPSSDEIAAALTDALTNDVKRAAIRLAAPNILSHFTWPHFADRWLEIVRTLTQPEGN